MTRMEAAAWDDRYRGSELVWSAEPNRWVRQELTGLPPGRALDLACGEGRNALWLARCGWHVVGVDFSAVALAKAARLAAAVSAGTGGTAADGAPAHLGTAPGQVLWVRADVTRPVALPRSVDLVVVAYLQLAAAARRRAMRLAAAALAGGGTLLVVAHDTANLTGGTGGPQTPAVLFTAQDADLVFFVYRDEYYNDETDQQGLAELILAKHRNGPTDAVKLAFLNRYAKFADLAA